MEDSTMQVIYGKTFNAGRRAEGFLDTQAANVAAFVWRRCARSSAPPSTAKPSATRTPARTARPRPGSSPVRRSGSSGGEMLHSVPRFLSHAGAGEGKRVELMLDRGGRLIVKQVEIASLR
jgi:hypothetical protein